MARAYFLPLRGLEGAGEGGRSWPSRSMCCRRLLIGFVSSEGAEPFGPGGVDITAAGSARCGGAVMFSKELFITRVSRIELRRKQVNSTLYKDWKLTMVQSDEDLDISEVLYLKCRAAVIRSHESWGSILASRYKI